MKTVLAMYDGDDVVVKDYHKHHGKDGITTVDTKTRTIVTRREDYQLGYHENQISTEQYDLTLNLSNGSISICPYNRHAIFVSDVKFIDHLLNKGVISHIGDVKGYKFWLVNKGYIVNTSWVVLHRER